MCPPPQIVSLPAPKKEQRDPPKDPGSGSYRLIRWGVEDTAEGWGERWREHFPYRAQRYGHAGEVRGSSVCARCERGIEPYQDIEQAPWAFWSQEARTWGSYRLPGPCCGGEGLWALMCVWVRGHMEPFCCD